MYLCTRTFTVGCSIFGEGLFWFLIFITSCSPILEISGVDCFLDLGSLNEFFIIEGNRFRIRGDEKVLGVG